MSTQTGKRKKMLGKKRFLHVCLVCSWTLPKGAWVSADLRIFKSTLILVRAVCKHEYSHRF